MIAIASQSAASLAGGGPFRRGSRSCFPGGPSVRSAPDEAIDWCSSLPFLAMHAACLLLLWTGVSRAALVVCFALYLIRMFGITAGYHRYFSHRSYRTSRLFQFVLAWIGCSALQKGPLWWAAHHRHHHQYSDQQRDVHSPRQRGFWWAHIGW